MSAPQSSPTEALLSAEGVSVEFAGGGGQRVKAVTAVDLAIARGECHGLVGESGCGKSTLGKALLRLTPLTAGRIHFDGTDITELKGAALRATRRRMQMVFQDPLASLDPRFTIERAVAEPLEIHGLAGGRDARRERVVELLADVGLDDSVLRRLPHELSGGQRQRVGVARALAVDPSFIVADEPVSALDVSVQAQLLNLLAELGRTRELAFLFISHDLRVVQHLCDVVSVMYLGRIVERAPTAQLFAAPAHPYTQALLAAVPSLEPGAAPAAGLRGEVPSPLSPPTGCAFHPRCPEAQIPGACSKRLPSLDPIAPGHNAACHLRHAPDRVDADQ